MELIIHQLEPCHLQEYLYRGEGNANLVIALPLTRSVLRFRKIMSSKAIDGVETRVLLEWKFFLKFISKFMGRFVTSPQVVHCHPRDFKDWYEKVEVFRPAHRKHKTLYENFAIKLPDYAQLPEHLDVDTRKPTFCIEIKPKQGFIPESERQTKHCPYCVKQFHKISKKIVQQRSKYCPCDLFSGDKTRVFHAISALVESPQNNFILFKDGHVVWGEGHPRDDLDTILNEFFNTESKEKNLEGFYYLIATSLYREFISGGQSEDLRNFVAENEGINSRSHEENSRFDEILEKFCDFPNGNLPKSSILGNLFRMQQLHSSSAAHVYEIYSKHSAHLNEEIVYFSESCEYKSQGNTIDFSDILILRNYLLFTTARDCSVLLTFREVDSKKLSNIPRDHVIVINNQTFVFNIGLTDLDPKPLDRIDKHRKRANNLFNC